jgi:hypothetical protein
VVFSQLYVAHPLEKTLDPAEIAAVIGVSPTEMLPSGRRWTSFAVILSILDLRSPFIGNSRNSP